MSNARMVHKDYEQLFPDYLRNALTAESARAIQGHLQSCPGCRGRLDELKLLFGELGSQFPASPPANYFTVFLPRLREKIEQKQPSFLDEPWVKRFAAPLAALTLGVALVVRLPLTGVEEPLQLKDLVRSLESEELVDVLVEESGRESLPQVSGAETIARTLPEGPASREFARKILNGENVGEAVFPHNLSDIGKEDLDLILQKLGERTLL